MSTLAIPPLPVLEGAICPLAGRDSGTVGQPGLLPFLNLLLTSLGCFSLEEEGRGFGRGLPLPSPGRPGGGEQWEGWVRLALVAGGTCISF